MLIKQNFSFKIQLFLYRSWLQVKLSLLFRKSKLLLQFNKISAIIKLTALINLSFIDLASLVNFTFKLSIFKILDLLF